MGYLTMVVTNWFMALSVPTNSQGAFASATVLACVGVIKYWVETSADDRHRKLSSESDE